MYPRVSLLCDALTGFNIGLQRRITNIKMDIKEMGWDRIRVADDVGWWWALVFMVIKLRRLSKKSSTCQRISILSCWYHWI
jgi:hypothetical protein